MLRMQARPSPAPVAPFRLARGRSVHAVSDRNALCTYLDGFGEKARDLAAALGRGVRDPRAMRMHVHGALADAAMHSRRNNSAERAEAQLQALVLRLQSCLGASL